MGVDVTIIILTIMFSIGEGYGTPICGPDDGRVTRGSMPYEVMVEKWGRDPECDGVAWYQEQ